MNFKATSGLVALFAIGAASVALAQSTPPSSTTSPSTTPPPSSYPQSSSPDTSTSSSSSMSESHKQLLKDCMANEKAKNTGETKDQIRQTCESQLKSSSSPH
jgi:hypothetical protein